MGALEEDGSGAAGVGFPRCPETSRTVGSTSRFWQGLRPVCARLKMLARVMAQPASLVQSPGVTAVWAWGDHPMRPPPGSPHSLGGHPLCPPSLPEKPWVSARAPASVPTRWPWGTKDLDSIGLGAPQLLVALI